MTLNRRNIFILPSRFGATYVLICGFIFILGTNYQNNLVLLLSMMMISLFLSCMLRCYHNLTGLTVSRAGQEERFAGEQLSYQLQLSGNKPHYQVELAFAGETETVIEEVEQQAQAAVYCRAQPRGFFDPGRISVRSRYPLGLFRAWSELDLQLRGVIYPEPIEGQRSLESQADGDEQGQQQLQQVDGDEFVGLRKHRPGESQSRIAWKQLAQGRGLLSKDFELRQGNPMWLVLKESGSRSLEFELSLLCGQVLELSRQQRSFGLQLADERLPPGKNEQHRQAALTLLACFGLPQPDTGEGR